MKTVEPLPATSPPPPHLAFAQHPGATAAASLSFLEGDRVSDAMLLRFARANQHDALRSPRPDKPALDHDMACDILLNGDGRTRPAPFDPMLLDAFRILHQDFAAVCTSLTD